MEVKPRVPGGAGRLPIAGRHVCLTLIVLWPQCSLQHHINGRHPLRPLLRSWSRHDVGSLWGGEGEAEVVVLAPSRHSLPHTVIVILVPQEDLTTWVCVLWEGDDAGWWKEEEG